MKQKVSDKEKAFMAAEAFGVHVSITAQKEGIDKDISNELGRTARIAWMAGHTAAIKLIENRLHDMANQKQIAEYIKSLE